MSPERFMCPHCHAPLAPGAMEVAFSDLAEYRICPACDEPVFYALRAAPLVPAWLRRGDLPLDETPTRGSAGPAR